MKETLQHIDLLEINVNKLCKVNKELREENLLLHQKIEQLSKENDFGLTEIEHLKKQIRTLKTANALLGSSKNKKETKLKINSLIREIDECIVQLAD